LTAGTAQLPPEFVATSKSGEYVTKITLLSEKGFANNPADRQNSNQDKGKPDESRGRKTTGLRDFLR
jgi:hypothetical protein